MQIDTTLDVISETGNLSRGGLKSYDEIKRDNVQRVRGDLLAPTYKSKITFAIDSVTFNMSCVNLFSDSQHIVINVDEDNQRIIIEPCSPTDRDSLKFANLRDGRNKPRKCITRIFCSMLYEMMGWNRTAKYRSMAIFHDWEDKKVIVFNLDECLQVITQMVDAGDGNKRQTEIIMPKDWEGRFGHTLDELEAKNRLDTTKTLITIDNKTGERHVNNITAKLPTPEELMHQPYGGIRIKQEVKDEEN
jgi:hypothetical protein